MASTDIVGYTFQAENLCPTCMRDKVITWGRFDPESTASTESLLADLAKVVGVDHMNERTYDSGDFPKVVFDSQVEDSEERCGGCHEPLIG
ncbi:MULTISPECIES: hypothetical protein [Mycobacteriaceae]|uniref:Uncharacterized protein n=1 Tax=Mycolicibacterium senegalense TaxID=1796 RepID=A0ABR5FMK4_9MYCO|nr:MULTISPECIES: hypothetical protein [Mycolicibacterium]KLI09380.1 hypothetical protein AA982_04935 [Mycolicibacterium senegalense]KLO47772.1 hypothetical protein ABW05_31955 [Mycolicibacterium senegalense]OMB74244.1 hypothetical protein A5741_04650 [Mycolicibacterium conceptionense]